MQLVAGVDSSTQATKVLVCDARTGEVVREGRAPHPNGTECPPSAWWGAFTSATAGGLLDGVAAIGVAGQQHGLVVLDEDGEVVRPALLWNDTRSAGAAADLVDELGGAAAWAEAVGSVPVASFTVTKLRWLAAHEPASAERVARVLLPHDWLTWKLTGPESTPVTDRGDASGTGYWSHAAGDYRLDLVKLAFGRAPKLPRVLGPTELAGRAATLVGGLDAGSAGDMLVAAGTGDNMGAALGLGAEPGDVVVSLGTSGTVFAVSETPTSETTGIVAGFADATGRFLPLVCTLNAARVLSATARMLGTDLVGLDDLALAAAPGAGGLVLLPYLDGERTPNLPDAAGTLTGLRRDRMTLENVARAAVEGMLCGLADGLDAIRALGVPTARVLLIGGAARSAAVRAIAPVVFGLPVVIPDPGEYVALGAARQAAWALLGGKRPPAWRVAATLMSATDEPTGPREQASGAPEDQPSGAGAEVRTRYAEVRRFVHGL